jgi:acyl-CoA reductase-like NAD-dependent aldehyde dehydrogenase
VKKLQLELGGKSAQILLGDVSEDFVRTIGFGQVLAHCGQGCVLQTRLLLPEHLMDAYKEGLETMKPFITIGDPHDETTVLGPLIREQQRARVEGYVQSGLDEGAELLCGGKRPDHMAKGFFYEPTVFVSSNDTRVAQEEIFGPVLTVVPYSGEDDDAVRLANNTIYGLGGGVVSASTARAFNVGRRLRAGLVQVQGVGADALPSSGPGAGQGPGWGAHMKGIGQSGAFGGYKQSGLGREWGRHGLEDFTEVKNLNWS